MKVGILTQPLYCNYGGMLQCFALQTVLKSLGHEAIVLQREFDREESISVRDLAIYYFKHFAKLLLGRESSWHYKASFDRKRYIAKNTSLFVEKWINPKTDHCYTTMQLKEAVDSLQLDAIVVGSDQVWRPDYSPCIHNYFLDFLEENTQIKKLAYAASFGSDKWFFSPKLTSECSMLIKRFDAISVRESSAVRMCRDYFGVKATHVLDPTMLIDKSIYEALVPHPKSRGELFCYLLDRSSEKQAIKENIAKETGYKTFENMPELFDSTYNLYGEIERCVYPPTEDWISAFIEAKMVVTDSFHGCVFSIIFNKPFWVIGNSGRGMARFQSLLSLFDLENRMISSSSICHQNWATPIDWSPVVSRLKRFKAEAYSFLTLNL